MIVNIIIALLAFFLAGAVPILAPGLVSFFIWCVILFIVAGVGFSRVGGERNHWIF